MRCERDSIQFDNRIAQIKYVSVDYPVNPDEPPLIISIHPHYNTGSAQLLMMPEPTKKDEDSIYIGYEDSNYLPKFENIINKKLNSVNEKIKNKTLLRLSISDIDNSYIEKLPKLPEFLYRLDFSNIAGFKCLPELPDNLGALGCYENGIEELPEVLPSNLRLLYCCDNKLKRLPEKVPSKLYKLLCANNCLTELPHSISDVLIMILICENNSLVCLPELKYSLEIFGCSFNKLTELPTLSYNLISLTIKDNYIKYLSIRNCRAILKLFNYSNYSMFGFHKTNVFGKPLLNLANNPFMTQFYDVAGEYSNATPEDLFNENMFPFHKDYLNGFVEEITIMRIEERKKQTVDVIDD